MAKLREIWKFPLCVNDDSQEVRLRVGAHVVHVGEQCGGICLWVEVVPSNIQTLKFYRVHGTGHPIKDGEHVGTVLLGSLVWHIYEVSAP